MSQKYPRSQHFSFSPGASSDDKIMSEDDFEVLVGEKLIFTEKLDGSNVCLTSQNVFSRSHSGPPTHDSFNPLKKLHAEIKETIPDGLSVFGEWCFAVHSIEYTLLQHHLNIFGIRNDENGEWWDWDEVEKMARWLGVPTVPVILVGSMPSKEILRKTIEAFSELSSIYGPIREGLVVRKYSGVYDDGQKLFGIGKWVRANHVQTSEHWTKQKIKKQNCIF